MNLGINLPKEYGNFERLRHHLMPYLEISRRPDWEIEKVVIPPDCKAEPFLRALTALYGISVEIGSVCLTNDSLAVKLGYGDPDAVVICLS